ncbi:MAG: tetratricopeptide repeat protein [Gallionella sp.]|nr:tetratricopeptide repeat protein [Gallionella sp.]
MRFPLFCATAFLVLLSSPSFAAPVASGQQKITVSAHNCSIAILIIGDNNIVKNIADPCNNPKRIKALIDKLMSLKPYIIQKAALNIKRGDRDDAIDYLFKIEDDAIAKNDKVTAAKATRLAALFSLNSDDAKDILRRATEYEPNDWLNWSLLGDMKKQVGNNRLNPEADYREAMRLIKESIQRDTEDNLDLKHWLAIVYDDIGDIRAQQGDQDSQNEALSFYILSLDIRKKLLASPAWLESGKKLLDTSAWQRSLSLSYEKIGAVQFTLRDFDGAEKSFNACLAIREKLIERDRKNSYKLDELGVVHSRIGDTQKEIGERQKNAAKLNEALNSYRNSMQFFEDLRKSDPTNLKWQHKWRHKLGMLHSKIGDIQQIQGELVAARKSYDASHQILESLVRHGSRNPMYQHILSVSHDKLGSILEAQNELKPALEHYQDAFRCVKRLLVEHDPTNARWQQDSAEYLLDISNLQRRMGKAQEAKISLDSAREILQQLKLLTDRSKWSNDLRVKFETAESPL